MQREMPKSKEREKEMDRWMMRRLFLVVRRRSYIHAPSRDLRSNSPNAAPCLLRLTLPFKPKASPSLQALSGVSVWSELKKLTTIPIKTTMYQSLSPRNKSMPNTSLGNGVRNTKNKL